LGHTQSPLCNVQPIQRGHFRLFPQDPARKVAQVPQHRHRQLPRRIAQGIQSDLGGELRSIQAHQYNIKYLTIKTLVIKPRVLDIYLRI
jgi:hypothetical protein